MYFKNGTLYSRTVTEVIKCGDDCSIESVTKNCTSYMKLKIKSNVACRILQFIMRGRADVSLETNELDHAGGVVSVVFVGLGEGLERVDHIFLNLHTNIKTRSSL